MKKIRFKSNLLGNVDINLSEAMIPNKMIISEEINKNDRTEIEKIINTELKKRDKDITSEITKAVKKEMGGKATEDQIVLVVTNCLVQLYKALWSGRSFWKSAISNKPN